MIDTATQLCLLVCTLGGPAETVDDVEEPRRLRGHRPFLAQHLLRLLLLVRRQGRIDKRLNAATTKPGIN